MANSSWGEMIVSRFYQFKCIFIDKPFYIIQDTMPKRIIGGQLNLSAYPDLLF
jgi:hypothetical protein